MHTETLTIPAGVPGTVRHLAVHRFGTRGARPCVYLQASLHADEIPAMLVADKLRRRLSALDAAGAVAGEVVLVPMANPLGLTQTVLGDLLGRFDLGDGGNFNRGFPDLTDAVAERVAPSLSGDAHANLTRIRAALAESVATAPALTPAEHLKRILLGLAVEADYVLDLHCDAEAMVHLYTLTPSAGAFAPLARLLRAEAVLLADVSGGEPFDEAVSRPWHELPARFPGRPIPFGCHSVTVELRGQADVDHHTAEADAAALVDWLTLAGAVRGEAPSLPEPLCAPTPLAGSEPLTAPAGGILVFRRDIGARVEPGDVIADIVDPLDGTVTPVATTTAGVFYARAAIRFTTPGKRIGKVAGTEPRRTGPLLSP